MKTFVVLSDSHGRNKRAFQKLAPLFAENDYVVHLGDGVADMRETFAEYPEKTYLVRGNCDLCYGEEELVIEAEGTSILCCHGHRYGVKGGLARLAARAKERDCEVALYGHTHRAAIDEIDGVLCVNPGAFGDYTEPTYCYLAVHRGKVTPTIVHI